MTAYTVENFYDPHTDRLAHVPFTPAFYAALARLSPAESTRFSGILTRP